MRPNARALAVLALCFHLGTVLGNNAPQISFSVTNYRLSVNENEAIGTELFIVTGTDQDSDAITITIRADTDTGSLVTVDPQPQNGNTRTARVLLAARLDRDRSPPSRELWFTVSDGSAQASGKVTLFIRDVNDNPPFFENQPYTLVLPEMPAATSPISKSVYRVSASDPDEGPGGTVIFSMTDADSEYAATFVIPDPSSGVIFLERPLDYETRSFYQYQVHARDQGTPPCPGAGCLCTNDTNDCSGSPARFTVTVTDVQDTAPEFQQLPYITTLYENASVGASVLTVAALDGDRGIPNPVNYTIEDEHLYPFSMNATSGLITVGEPGLDADNPEGRSYFITVVATEVEAEGRMQYGPTTATTQVSITVQDVNDNGPVFGRSLYYATVQENTPVGVPIAITNTVNVTDSDQNTNSLFSLSVEKDGGGYQAFSTLPSPDTPIQGFTSVMVSVKNSSVLDYEKRHNITFQIRAQETATSEKYYNLTTIVLTITDMNDNSPVFADNQAEEVNVTEHAPRDTPLATFTATDLDSGDFGTVAYSLENDYSGRFGIDPSSGELTVQGDIDRDTGDERFTLVVVASDSVNAADPNQRRSARHTVKVVVQDVNDNSPVFLQHLPQVAVQENAAVNTTTLMTLTARDADQGKNGEVRYHVTSIDPPTSPPSPPLFGIQDTTGEVYVSASLIGHPGSFNVTFMASDRGAEPRNATTMVTVKVKDVNLKPPRFVTPDQGQVNTTAGLVPNITIDEEEAIGTFIMQLVANDSDTGVNGQVLFYLDPDLDSAFLSFQVDSRSGNLSNRVRLDCDEGKDAYQINLRAQDQGELVSLTTVIPFIVYLRDKDDNSPQFAPGAVLDLSVQEMAADVPVGFVNISTDIDRDPENRVACYYLYGGDLLSSFTLNKTSGELRLLTPLDRTQTQEVSLEVKATKNCSLDEGHFTSGANSSNNDTSSSSSGGVNSVLKVRVGVRDINNHPPVFDKDALTVGLLYNVDIGTVVTNLAKYTSDQDTAENSKHQYRLLKFRAPNSSPQGPDSTFAVSVNGSVVTRRIFRSDESGNFVLTVQAFDSDNMTDTANLTIYLVSDLQRIKLIFNKDPNEVNLIKGEMVKRLGEALGMTVIADKIATHITDQGTPDPLRTDVFIHARYIPSGEIVPTSELVSAFDYNQEVQAIIQQYGGARVSSIKEPAESTDDNKAQIVFIIVIIVLGIITVALILVLISTVQRFRRRLKAATTSAFVTTKDLPNNNIPPGTNKYYTSENPLFGKDVKPADFDKTQDKDDDSLDENAVDGGHRVDSRNGEGEEDEPEEEQEMFLDMYDDDLGRGARVNRLAMVLHEYDNQHAHTGPTPTPAMAASMLGDFSEVRTPTLGGHAKADSGFNENSAFEYDLEGLQHTDI
ncbi:cadherin-23-like isoform X2 [Babylonia areolata]|uniref:cadherin-23-like isoform X2 n=1 Tax=Babylonia areolata TaxID=304850 RepID=UPI003FD5F2B8